MKPQLYLESSTKHYVKELGTIWRPTADRIFEDLRITRQWCRPWQSRVTRQRTSRHCTIWYRPGGPSLSDTLCHCTQPGDMICWKQQVVCFQLLLKDETRLSELAKIRRVSTLGQGVIAPSPNLGLAPKCDIKHCLTNSKHRHIIGAKGSVLWLLSTSEYVPGLPVVKLTTP